MDIEQTKITTRTDLAQLLASLGEPGKNRAKKLATVAELNLKNMQGHSLELTLETYEEF